MLYIHVSFHLADAYVQSSVQVWQMAHNKRTVPAVEGSTGFYPFTHLVARVHWGDSVAQLYTGLFNGKVLEWEQGEYSQRGPWDVCLG